MTDNKNLLLPGAILLASLIIVAGLFLSNAFSFKMAVFDISKVSKDSSLGQKFQKEIQTKGKDLQTKFQVAKSDSEKTAIQDEFNKFQTEKNNEFASKVKQAVATVSKRKGIKAVGSPQVFVYSETDITSDVIKELDK